ncbi:RnfABCDGE type electron transport complex subunit D [Tichowtungia aerotolerans]|uniref:Ion-translocating oxidoreductase complex subunit D n=1 Tax=Tichowtungia aerotolerans TaxID=2697043 RepID=A0A6P1M928_9BACT|nr:RnfABCDGE type electron transport complex subunit D [Tichowtungia aerotolerans]QHI70532.1 RnfABCDGE type electron transport complex subunit D [Tichowtungia aerotolerans]
MAEETTTPAIQLPDATKLVVSNSPHIRGNETISKVMVQVLLALLPAAIAAVWFFGLAALKVMVLCTVGCIAVEEIWNKCTKRATTWKDGSAAITGLLLAMNLSSGTPWWICILGCLLAIILGKQLFGGLGFNPFNPALVARVALLIGFPSLMTSWVAPTPGNLTVCDAMTGATPLGAQGEAVASLADLFSGNVGGCLGETSALALLLGGAFLIVRKLIKWQVPAAFIGTVVVISGLVHAINPEITQTPIYHVLAGGLLIGAFFMATDMVTSPMTAKGALIFGCGCGLITSVIRIWGGYPEGVSFSILFMNALTPLIDRYTIGKPFGYIRVKKEAA